MELEALLTQWGPDPLLVAHDGVVAFANAALHGLLAAAPGTLVGRPLAELVGPGELDRVQTVLAQRRQGLEDLPQTLRLILKRDDGAEVVADACFASNGADLVLSARDATELVRAERLTGRLSELSRGGHNLIGADAMLDAAEPVFAELGWRGALTRVVPEGCVVLRPVACAPGDPIGEYAKSLVGRVLPPERTPVLTQVVAAGSAIFLDNAPQFLTGPLSAAVPLSASLIKSHAYRSAWCPVRTGDGALSHVLSLAGRGMTEHDFVALQLFAAQLGSAIDLARLNAELVRRERLAAVGEMAAVLAHEVRNPLAVVFNVVAGLRRHVPGREGQALLGVVSEEAERLKRLVDDLLAFSRPAPPELRTVTLAPLVEDVVAAAMHDPVLAARPGATPEVVIDAATPDVTADPTMLRRALLNLMLNALQHVSAGGRVEVRAHGADGHAELRVYNDGPPLPPGQHERIFEPFFTTRATGTGLGLAVVRRVMDDLHGTVGVEPAEAGVAFVLTLPAA